MSGGYVLGLDTSNYTTSAALYSLDENTVTHNRRLLPVQKGGRGLRQSDAVFHHTAALHEIIGELYRDLDFVPDIKAIGVSSRPRSEEGSYMPCFLVGANAAHILGTVMNAPVYEFSHQAGHIAAAIYSCGNSDLYNKKFLAFHVSGGTTEAVIVTPDKNNVFNCEIVGKTLDLHAGQAVDRVGVMMGLDFPCGKELEKLALTCSEKPRVKICVKDCDCCLSGIENICSKMAENNEDKPLIAMTCLTFIEKTLETMCKNIIEKYGEMPILFAGGVMSNTIIRNGLSARFPCRFASVELSSDNACGTAILAARSCFAN
ncbi:MAG: peptidase M22 [Clostridia bacterium]|nr:peptidase M22 [Clostridia bacterium]